MVEAAEVVVDSSTIAAEDSSASAVVGVVACALAPEAEYTCHTRRREHSAPFWLQSKSNML